MSTVERIDFSNRSVQFIHEHDEHDEQIEKEMKVRRYTASVIVLFSVNSAVNMMIAGAVPYVFFLFITILSSLATIQMKDTSMYNVQKFFFGFMVACAIKYYFVL